MLQRLSDHIRACHKRAAEAEELAAHCDGEQKSHYLDMAQRWTYLAKSYEFTERLERFLLDLDKRKPAPRPNAAWSPIAGAPYDRDLRLAVLDSHGTAHALAFPARRILRGWIDAATRDRLQLRPTHWQEWVETP